MKNTVERSRHWALFLARRTEFPRGPSLLAQFQAGQVKSLCACGCESFEFTPTSDPEVALLSPPDGKYGAVFELAFRANQENTSVEFPVFADGSGKLAGIQVDYCANSYPMPENVELIEPPYYVRVSTAADA